MINTRPASYRPGLSLRGVVGSADSLPRGSCVAVILYCCHTTHSLAAISTTGAAKITAMVAVITIWSMVIVFPFAVANVGQDCQLFGGVE